MKKAPETFADYLKRMEGFADFKPLNKEQWEAEVAANTGNWEGLKLDPYPAPLQTPMLKENLNEGKSKDSIDQCLVCGTEIPPGPDSCSTACEDKLEAVRQEIRQAGAPKELQSVTAEEVGKIEDLGIL